MQHVFAMMLQPDPYQSVPPLYADNATIWHHMSGALHQSLYRVVTLLIAFLPGIIAFIVALALSTLIGMAFSALLRRGLVAARFDDRFARNHGSVDWAPSGSLSELIARTAFWACILVGLIIGVSACDAAYATAATQSSSFLPYFTHIIGAVLLLVAGTLIARFLARSVLIGAVNSIKVMIVFFPKAAHGRFDRITPAKIEHKTIKAYFLQSFNILLLPGCGIHAPAFFPKKARRVPPQSRRAACNQGRFFFSFHSRIQSF